MASSRVAVSAGASVVCSTLVCPYLTSRLPLGLAIQPIASLITARASFPSFCRSVGLTKFPGGAGEWGLPASGVLRTFMRVSPVLLEPLPWAPLKEQPYIEPAQPTDTAEV